MYISSFIHYSIIINVVHHYPYISVFGLLITFNIYTTINEQEWNSIATENSQ